MTINYNSAAKVHYSFTESESVRKILETCLNNWDTWNNDEKLFNGNLLAIARLTELGLGHWSIKWTNSTIYAGMTYHTFDGTDLPTEGHERPNSFDFSMKFLVTNGVDFWWNTINHEAAHALVGLTDEYGCLRQYEGHDDEWYNKCYQLGGAPEMFLEREEANRRLYRFRWDCPACEETIYRATKNTKPVICKNCLNETGVKVLCVQQPNPDYLHDLSMTATMKRVSKTSRLSQGIGVSSIKGTAKQPHC